MVGNRKKRGKVNFKMGRVREKAIKTPTIKQAALNCQFRPRKENLKVRIVCSPKETTCAATSRKATGHCYHTESIRNMENGLHVISWEPGL